VLFTDRKRPEITFVSPMAGRVAEIAFGQRRFLSYLTIERAGGESGEGRPDPVEGGSDNNVRAALLARGLWPAFVERPFGGIPNPQARPSAMFVTATRGSPLSPDPAIMLTPDLPAFRDGVAQLTHLTEGKVHVCLGPGADLANFDGIGDRVEVTRFTGSTAAGRAGTHVYRLHPAVPGRTVWTINWQDVVAMGHLFLTGAYRADRVVALAGPCAARPRLIRTCLGACLEDLPAEEFSAANVPPQILSGDETTGRPAQWLGRYHDQITLTGAGFARRRGWLAQLIRRPTALVPVTALDHALPFDILPVPLMRALSVGDAEAAVQLGCLDLLEEDIAPLSAICTSGADYAALLREVLDELAAAVAA
jgi:Na+-transporting NADH:ubiquinone oxidoreductase subunit A